jgi:tripartite-type tricarboxylate transporter receptor subunit TctC
MPASVSRRPLLAGLGGLLASPLAAEEAWPRSTLRILVPFAPGGATDIAARVLAPALQAELGRNVVVENRPGGGGTIAAEAVARATDQHTLFLTSGSTQSVAPALFPVLRYDPVKDMAPLCLLARVPHVLVVPRQLGVRDVPGLVARLKAEPGKHNFATSGAGSLPHLAGELFRLQAGVEATAIPFRGSAPAITALLQGDCSYMLDSLPSTIGQIQDGSLLAIGAGTRTRIVAMPELVPIAEQGLPDFESYTWVALYATANLPAAGLALAAEATARAMRQPEVQRRYAELGMEIANGGPAELAALQRAEYEKWGAVIRQAGITPEGGP